MSSKMQDWLSSLLRHQRKEARHCVSLRFHKYDWVINHAGRLGYLLRLVIDAGILKRHTVV